MSKEASIIEIAIGRRVRLVGVKFILHSLALLLTCTTIAALLRLSRMMRVVEATTVKHEVDFGAMVLNPDTRPCQLHHRYCGRRSSPPYPVCLRDELSCTVMVAGLCSVFFNHQTEFTFAGVAFAVIRVIDEIHRNDSPSASLRIMMPRSKSSDLATTSRQSRLSVTSNVRTVSPRGIPWYRCPCPRSSSD